MLTRRTQKNLTWIDLVAPTPSEVREVMREFDFSPAIAQELLSVSSRSSVERHEDSIYTVFHFPFMWRGRDSRATQELDFIIGKQYLITTRYETIAPFDTFAKSFEVGSMLGHSTQQFHGGHLFVAIMKHLYRTLLDESDALQGKLADIEDRIFSGNEKRMVFEISEVGKSIYDFRQALFSHGEMLRSLEAPGERLFGHEFGYYVRGVIGEYERVKAVVDGMRESMTELRKTNDSLLSTKQNEIMKTLTIMAFVTFPLSLISGIFGMNTAWLPFVGVSGDFWIIIGGMVLLTLFFFMYFKKRGWL
jgi:magnesium transporter